MGFCMIYTGLKISISVVYNWQRNKCLLFLSGEIFMNSQSSMLDQLSFLPKSCCLVAQSCPTLCNPMDCNPPGSSVHEDFPGKNTGMGCHAFLQGILPPQELNQGLLHCRQVLYQLSYQGNFWIVYLTLKSCLIELIWISIKGFWKLVSKENLAIIMEDSCLSPQYLKFYY